MILVFMIMPNKNFIATEKSFNNLHNILYRLCTTVGPVNCENLLFVRRRQCIRKYFFPCSVVFVEVFNLLVRNYVNRRDCFYRYHRVM